MTVSLRVGGQRHAGWKSITIDRSMETLSGAFRVGLAERWDESFTPREIEDGDRVECLIGGDVVVTGWVDDVRVDYDARMHELEIAGRDASGDLVDCSAINTPGQWRNRKLEAIAAAIAQPFGIGVRAEVDTGAPFATFDLEQGETAHEAIQRLCRLRAILCIADRRGNLLLTRAGHRRASTALVEGENILMASAIRTQKERFSQVLVKGQTQGSDQIDAQTMTKAAGQFLDPGVKRYRPLLLTAEGQADSARCQERAAWEGTTRYGKAIQASVTVPGWRQESGDLWDINTLVRLESPMLKLNETLLISELTYTLDESGGEVTTLGLTRPEAFQLLKELPAS